MLVRPLLPSAGHALTARGLLATVLLAAGCAPTPRSESASITASVSPAPPRVGPAVLVVRIADAQGAPVAGARVRTVADMSHPGMRPVVSEAAPREDGAYESRFAFDMAGAWAVTVTARLPDGRSVTQVVDLPHVRAR